jgi:hypothetical protein
MDLKAEIAELVDDVSIFKLIPILIVLINFC